MTHTGRCQCGNITFEVSADPLMSGQCHCLDCQKASGTGHTTMIAFPQGSVKIEGKTATYQSPADSGATITRYFCPRCGSRLFGSSSGMPQLFTVNAGALDDPSLYKPMMTVYTKRLQPWDAVATGAPSFDMMPPGGP
jgi:hypothetical protein